MSSVKITLPRRLFHWTNLIAIAALAVTGWYIHKPFVPGSMGLVRQIHFVFAFVFAINTLLRVYYAFTPAGDWRKYLKPQISKERIRLVFRHYAFYEHLPEGEEFRLLQNASYLALVLLFGVQIFTGILMYNPEGGVTGIINWLGGLSAVRQAHLLLQWAFIAFTIIHLYMVVSEELFQVKNIFFGITSGKEGVVNER